MRVETVTTMERFSTIRTAWDALYAADPHAQLFLSWPWLRAYLPLARLRWRVVALWDDDALLAALPLGTRPLPGPLRVVEGELALGTDPTGDYAGMLCGPASEAAALEALAFHVAYHERWDNFDLRDVRDPRLAALAARIGAWTGARLRDDGETTCLSVDLPESWDAYLAAMPSKARWNTRRTLRRIAELPGYRVTEARDEDLDAHVEALIALNHRRRGGNLGGARRRYGGLFRNALRTGCARIFIAWLGDRPISGAALFTDEERRHLGVYMLGFDAAYTSYGPGRALVAHLVRLAIAERYRVFDFLRGDERYKRDFAWDETRTRHYRLTRPGLRAAAVNGLRPLVLGAKLGLANVVYGGGRSL